MEKRDNVNYFIVVLAQKYNIHHCTWEDKVYANNVFQLFKYVLKTWVDINILIYLKIIVYLCNE